MKSVKAILISICFITVLSFSSAAQTVTIINHHPDPVDVVYWTNTCGHPVNWFISVAGNSSAIAPLNMGDLIWYTINCGGANAARHPNIPVYDCLNNPPYSGSVATFDCNSNANYGISSYTYDNTLTGNKGWITIHP